MKHLFLYISFFACISLYGQKNRHILIDEYVRNTDKNIKVNRASPKHLDHMSIPGGAVTGFYRNKKLVMIRTMSGGEYGFTSYHFYIKDDTLVFVKEYYQGSKMPEPGDEKANAEFDAWLEKHTDKNGITDCSKLPPQCDDENSYYMSDSVIIDFKLKSFGKPVTPIEDKIAKANKNIIYRYKIHRKELE